MKGERVNFVTMNTLVKLKYTFFLIVSGENTLHLESYRRDNLTSPTILQIEQYSEICLHNEQ